MLNKLIENFDELMIDSFANYLCQKLIKVAKEDQIDQILLNVRLSGIFKLCYRSSHIL